VKPRTLVSELLLAHFGVVAVTCVLLVVGGLAAGATLLRANQDDVLTRMAAATCGGILAERAEVSTMEGAAQLFFGESHVEDFRYELLDDTGRVLLGVGALEGWRPAAEPRIDGQVQTEGSFRVFSHRCTSGYSARVATRDVLAHPEVQRLATIMLAALPAAIIVGMVLGRGLFRRSLLPLTRLQQAAVRSEAQPEVALRVATSARELKRLQEAFNGLLARLGDALARERRFSQEASHELRTPLAVLRARLDTLATALENDPKRAAEVASCMKEIDSLASLVDQLLFLARSESAPLPLFPVNLCDLARDAARRLVLADGRGSAAPEVEAPDEILVEGNEELLARAVGNLVENARKFAGPAARIRVSVREDGRRAMLTVADDGPGIADALRPHVFERFVRGAEGRTRTTGAGLGLAVARATALRHGGDVTSSRGELGGESITITLPLLGQQLA